MLCYYKRTGKLEGHWCNECPPSDKYFMIEKKEAADLRALNKELREKAGKGVRH